MTGGVPFQYATVRVVPSLERGEFLNAGVILFCRQKRWLGVEIALNEDRLASLAPGYAADQLRLHLDALVAVAAGDPAGGAVAGLPQSERFHWLVAPSSTVVQASPVHTGLCEDPAATLSHLVERLAAEIEAARR